MNHYEMLCVLPGTLTEEEASAFVKTISGILTEHGASLDNTQEMGKSRLAYPIKHIRYGYFCIFCFSSEVDKLKEIERRVRLSGDILRVMINAHDPNKKPMDVAKFLLAQQGPQLKDTLTEEQKVEANIIQEERIEPVSPRKEAADVKEASSSEVTLEQIDEKLNEILGKDF